MNTTEKLYEAFISGELEIAPESVISRAELAELENRLGLSQRLSEEQRDELRELLLDVAGDYGKKMFEAGFKLSRELAAVSE